MSLFEPPIHTQHDLFEAVKVASNDGNLSNITSPAPHESIYNPAQMSHSLLRAARTESSTAIDRTTINKSKRVVKKVYIIISVPTLQMESEKRGNLSPKLLCLVLRLLSIVCRGKAGKAMSHFPPAFSLSLSPRLDGNDLCFT